MALKWMIILVTVRIIHPGWMMPVDDDKTKQSFDSKIPPARRVPFFHPTTRPVSTLVFLEQYGRGSRNCHLSLIPALMGSFCHHSRRGLPLCVFRVFSVLPLLSALVSFVCTCIIFHIFYGGFVLFRILV